MIYYTNILEKYLPFLTKILKNRTKILDMNNFQEHVDKIMDQILNNLLANYILRQQLLFMSQILNS